MGKIKVLSVAELLARGIRSIHEESSISELLFDFASIRFSSSEVMRKGRKQWQTRS